jgi:iron complex transport system ATP-binding protein
MGVYDFSAYRNRWLRWRILVAIEVRQKIQMKIHRVFNLTCPLIVTLSWPMPRCGAGKSTLMQLLTGGLRPEARSETHCALFGHEHYAISELRHKIGIVMHEDLFRMHPAELALDLVLSSFRGAYGRTSDMRFSTNEKKLAMNTLDRLKVADLAQREFGRLSSGEKQRLLLARAMVHDPAVLVLDEPTSALDFAAAIAFSEIMRELILTSHTLVLVTHHPAEIPPEITRAILLRKGTIFADGAKRQAITTASLSDLYQFPLKVRWSDGWCHVTPQAV